MSLVSVIFLVVFGAVAVALSSLLFLLAQGLRGAAWLARGAGRLLQRRSAPPVEPGPPDCASTAPLVVAVHGTFAPHAPWARPGSPLCRALAARTGPGWLWHALDWTGANTVAARLDTIRRLNLLLAQVFAAQPGRTVCLVGHSHGGNIALKAAEAFVDQPGLGLVTLATPFLVAQPRPGAALFALAIPFFDLFVIAAVAWPLCLFLFDAWLAGAAVTALLLLLGALRQPRVAAAVAADEADLYASTPDLATLDRLRPRTLVISRGGDEADGGLKLVSLVNGWIARSLRQAELFSVVPEFQRFSAAHGLPEIRSGAVPAPLAVDWKALRRPAMKAAWPLLLRIFRNRNQAIAESVAVWFGLRLLQLLQPLVGTRTAAVAATIVVTSSETPPGEWRHLQTLASIGDDDALLSHSQIYDDPAVVPAIAAFMTGLQRAGAGESAAS